MAARVEIKALNPLPKPPQNMNPLSNEPATGAPQEGSDEDNGDRRPWTDQEDALVLDLVQKYGSKKW